jgi:hypothetical protein
MIREVNCDTIKSSRAMLSDTRTVITTNGRRYALVIHGDGTVGVCADTPDIPAFCTVSSVTEALEAIRSHSGGNVKDLY